MSAFLHFGCYECGWAARSELRIYARWDVRIRGFVDEERQTSRRRRNKVGKPGSGRRVPEDGQFPWRREGCKFMHDKADARICQLRAIIKKLGRRRATRTSVDEWPSAHAYDAPEAASLCKVPPVPILIAEHVFPRLFIFVQSLVVAGRPWVRRREELVDGVAVGRVGVRQRERGAEEGAKASRAVQVDPRLMEWIVRAIFSYVRYKLTEVPREETFSGWGKPRMQRKKVGRPMTWSAGMQQSVV